jgi:hypothetical protein
MKRYIICTVRPHCSDPYRVGGAASFQLCTNLGGLCDRGKHLDFGTGTVKPGLGYVMTGVDLVQLVDSFTRQCFFLLRKCHAHAGTSHDEEETPSYRDERQR